MTPSAQALWDRYRALHPDAPQQPYESFHFCDNAEDADICADLVVRDIKRATAASVAELELFGMRPARVGDVSVVTTWDGTAVAVIETTQIEVRRLGDVDEAFAQREGEGDQTLTWWRAAHEAYYRRILKDTAYVVDDDLLIVCEHFERVL
ncbi:ASCH domain-containing protein [Brevundimonas sp. BH3]|uniref:ASCH domain-containing protein n=1 Tax=Brevundimonas sp. BH3 TaxID=3133089 RepID=UPI00324D06A5